MRLFSVHSVFLVLACFLGCREDRPNTVVGVPNLPSRADSNKEVSTNIGSESKPSMQNGESHAHQAGEHGGLMVSLGRDSYHLEAVFDDQGNIRLYTLGQDETRVIDVEPQTLKGFVKGEGDASAKEISLTPEPQDGDAPNRTSLFLGKLSPEHVGKPIEITIPSIKIDGERFRVGVKSQPKEHLASSHEQEMPGKIAESEEDALYLTASGRYTTSDIAANGNVTPTQKFKGIKSNHDMSPKVGDRICPITQTKANPKFTWIVDGKSYQFCCPPCIDEFVKGAKGSDLPLAAPESFTKE